MLNVFKSSNLHLFKKIIAMINQFFSFLAEDVKRSNDLLSVLLQNIDTLFFTDKTMSTVVYYAINAN